MSLFKCSECGVIENTALAMYWSRSLDGLPPLCSQCHPDIGKWHGLFPRQTPEEAGLVLNDRGFYGPPEEASDG